VCINSFNETGQTLDIFNVLLTLDTLIKATVRRVAGESKPLRRDTKIIILVTEKTNITLIKQAISMPYVYAVTKVLEREDQVSEASEYIKKLTTGEVTHHPDIINLLKSKKKLVEKNKDTITLTVRQSQILQLVQTRGASNKTIAKMLGISESTVKLHMGAILKKYGAKNRTQLAVFSTENSL
jgi:two-component system nitrate/nitrite response regulator NarL